MNFHQPLRVIHLIATRLNQRMRDNFTPAVMLQARAETGLKPALDEVRRHLRETPRGWEMTVAMEADISNGIKVLMGLDMIDSLYQWRGAFTLEFVYFPDESIKYLALRHISVTIPPDKQVAQDPQRQRLHPQRTKILLGLDLKGSEVSTTLTSELPSPMRAVMLSLLTELKTEEVFDPYANKALDSLCYGMKNI